MKKAIIFDVDGVLIDSNKIIVEAYQKTAKKLGLRVPPLQEILVLFGKPLEEIVRILWSDANHELIIKEFRELFMDKNLVIPEVDGAVNAVKKIKNSGFKLGIISGKIMFFIKKHLEETGFDIEWFEAISSFEVTKKHKPYPEPLLYVIDKLNVKSEETLYIGDAISDYECAKNAKVEYVAVLTGCLNREELEKLGVKNIINSVAELPKFLRL
jgi:HAD superfamily hydrolase (TIGR01549 family)